MTDSHAVSTTLRAIRAGLDLTQEQLADRLGVSFASVNRWEGGLIMPQKAAREAIAALAAEAGGDASDSAGEPAETAARVTRRRTGGARRRSTPSTKTMEQMLWDGGLLHPGREGRRQVQGLSLAAAVSQAAVRCLRRRDRAPGRRIRRPRHRAGDRRGRPWPVALLPAAGSSLGGRQRARGRRRGLGTSASI